MDSVDRKILAELQQDGRLTVTELAERVQLSVSPCHRRLKALEQAGVIDGYHAHLDAAALGLSFSAIVFVTLGVGDKATVASFEEAVTRVDAVITAQRLFGDPDFMLNVVAADLTAFQRLYDDQLSALPGVQRLTSTLVMKTIVDNRPLPL